ncbi:MAG: four helix bundle protein [Chloroflexi bacterium]|nr:four helix bundle protein [Chloroflexota bacterium]MDL1943227.1 four helix bundle protein [Chloroflexi bacterium CFX2]
MSNDNIQGLETLEAWKKARAFVLVVYKEALPLLPVEEKWHLNQQIRRSAQSVSANIAEGHGRFYYQENVRFCYIARGSLTETYTHLSLAHDLQYIPDELHTRLKGQIEELIRIINGYIAYLKRSKRGEKEPGANYAVREEAIVYLTGNDTPPEDK